MPLHSGTEHFIINRLKFYTGCGDKCDKLEEVFVHLKSNKKIRLDPFLILKNKGDIRDFVFFFCKTSFPQKNLLITHNCARL